METIGSPTAFGMSLTIPPLVWTSAVARMAGTFIASADYHRGVVTRRRRRGSTPRDRARSLQLGCRLISDRLRLDVQTHGRVPDYPCVIASNHVSYIDPIAVAQELPFSAVAKLEVGGWPGVGTVLDDLGVLFVRRDDPASGAVALRKCIRLLDRGVPVLVYPEGTTSSGDDVLPFKRGAFGAAAIAGVPVVPVAMRYPWRGAAWIGNEGFLPHFLRMHQRVSIPVELHFGRPIEPPSVEAAAAVAESARDQVRSLIVR